MALQLNESDISPLVDSSVIQASTDKLVAAVARLKKAEVDYDAAAAAHEIATLASIRAAADGGDVMAAELVLESAARTLSVSGKILEAAKKARELAHADLVPARGRAHQEVFRKGIFIRLAASRQADAARAMLAAAQKEFDTGTAYLTRAKQNGTFPFFDNPGPPDAMGTYKTGVAVWSQVNARGGDWDGKKLDLAPA
jgi:hypothetical protein